MFCMQADRERGRYKEANNRFRTFANATKTVSVTPVLLCLTFIPQDNYTLASQLTKFCWQII
jgi:hypothetical protein